MQLITLLLFTVSILTLLSGFSQWIGSRKTDRAHAGMFFLTTICSSLWAVAVAVFLSLKPEQEGIAPLVIYGIYIPSVFMDVFLIAYLNWNNNIGKFLTTIFVAIALFITGALLYDHTILYSEIEIAASGNSIKIVNDWYYWVYLAYFVIASFVIAGSLIYQIAKIRAKNQKMGRIILLVGFAFTGVASLIFDILLPFGIRYDLIWVGPLTISATIIAFYYAALRYRIIQLSSAWLKVMSYVVIMTSAAIIYMLLFFVVFTALFKVPNPSTEVFVLNFIMIAIVLLLLPVINELSAFIRSLIQTNQVDVAYVVKKMNKMANSNVNLNELAEFLADHLHFAYIGFIINGKVYGSATLPITPEELKQVELLKAPEKGMWLSFNEPVSRAFSRLDINAMAELQNAKGKPFGQLLVGKPQGKMGFDRRDLIQLEMIINLVAAMIDTKA
ncbi:hypothetical protein IJG73_01540 [Candidatus Saccharibacteria bacterium]|nr:hypothetical protein [Candidatus Saccharibacteria bacterium]